jgi:FAD:protein FMN transferase
VDAAVEVLDLASCGFRAMGTDVTVSVLEGDDADLHWAHHEVERLEQLWSRFRADSDVTRANRAAGTWVPVAPETIDLAGAALAAWSATSGAFDPLLGDRLSALGYDRSFEQVDPTSAGLASIDPAVPARGLQDLLVDPARGSIRIAMGRALDLGGIAKGWTADLLVGQLLACGAMGACVNLGGDLAVGGRPPRAEGWIVSVDHQAANGSPAMLAVRDGGVATSTTLRRRWRGPAGDDRHHLLDPGRGGPCTGQLVEATAVAATAARAEVLTKVAFAAPHRLLPSMASRNELLLLTTADGVTEAVGDPALARSVTGATCRAR